jgi:XTP/dITP diphosphohydrolase
MPSPRSNRPITLILATRNRHKTAEIDALLSERFQLQTLNEFPGAPELVEDAATFAGNATRKAVQLAGWLAETVCDFGSSGRGRDVFVLADDSGLEVAALGGAPGVLSARFAALDSTSGISGAEKNSPDAANSTKLLRLLEGVPIEKRAARFVCVLALTPVLASEAGNRSPVCAANELELQTQVFEGICEGRIELTPRGQAGFGYDPLFVPKGYDRSFAQLGEEIKNRISHRSAALRKLRARLEDLPNHGRTTR